MSKEKTAYIPKYYKDEYYLAECSDLYWSESKDRNWFMSAQYSVNDIRRGLHLIDDEKSYNLAKNLWSIFGYGEEEIRAELIAYKAFKEAKKISRALYYYIRINNRYYLDPVGKFNEDYAWCNVYLNSIQKVSVKLDDGSEYFLIQPCPHLIFPLIDAHLNERESRESEAYEKFQEFFSHILRMYEQDSKREYFEG